MSIKTLSKKMLAIVAAGAMTMGLAMPTSVFAAGGDTATKVTEAYISKTYNTEVGKAEKFSFTATQVTGEGLVSDPLNPIMPSISFTAGETGTKIKRDKITFPTFKSDKVANGAPIESLSSNINSETLWILGESLSMFSAEIVISHE